MKEDQILEARYDKRENDLYISSKSLSRWFDALASAFADEGRMKYAAAVLETKEYVKDMVERSIPKKTR